MGEEKEQLLSVSSGVCLCGWVGEREREREREATEVFVYGCALCFWTGRLQATPLAVNLLVGQRIGSRLKARNMEAETDNLVSLQSFRRHDLRLREESRSLERGLGKEDGGGGRVNKPVKGSAGAYWSASRCTIDSCEQNLRRNR